MLFLDCCSGTALEKRSLPSGWKWAVYKAKSSYAIEVVKFFAIFNKHNTDFDFENYFPKESKLFTAKHEVIFSILSQHLMSGDLD